MWDQVKENFNGCQRLLSFFIYCKNIFKHQDHYKKENRNFSKNSSQKHTRKKKFKFPYLMIWHYSSKNNNSQMNNNFQKSFSDATTKLWEIKKVERGKTICVRQFREKPFPLTIW